ncbi:Anthranilate 1,2-dioxygenase electron transfer component [compost metagenome]
MLSEPTPSWTGKRGYIAEHFDASELRDAPADLYVCGPVPMVESIRTWLASQSLENVQLYYEKFTESNA